MSARRFRKTCKNTCSNKLTHQEDSADTDCTSRCHRDLCAYMSDLETGASQVGAMLESDRISCRTTALTCRMPPAVIQRGPSSESFRCKSKVVDHCREVQRVKCADFEGRRRTECKTSDLLVSGLFVSNKWL